MISLNVNYLLKALPPDTAKLRARTSTHGLGEGRRTSTYSTGIVVNAIH